MNKEAEYWRKQIAGMDDKQLVRWIRQRVEDKFTAPLQLKETRQVWQSCTSRGCGVLHHQGHVITQERTVTPWRENG